MLSILCDFDGVLCNLDSPTAVQRIRAVQLQMRLPAQHLLARYFFSNPYFRAIDEGKMSYEEMLSAIMARCWRSDFNSWSALWSQIWECYRTDPLMMKLLKRLLQENISVRIITDNHQLFRSWLRSRDELAFLENYLTCSAELGVCKPSRAFFDSALTSALSTPSEACVIDDSPKNVRGASRLGLKSILHIHPRRTISQLACTPEFQFLGKL